MDGYVIHPMLIYLMRALGKLMIVSSFVSLFSGLAATGAYFGEYKLKKIMSVFIISTAFFVLMPSEYTIVKMIVFSSITKEDVVQDKDVLEEKVRFLFDVVENGKPKSKSDEK